MSERGASHLLIFQIRILYFVANFYIMVIRASKLPDGLEKKKSLTNCSI